MYTVGIITASDKGSRGEREDLSGAIIKEIMTANGYEVKEYCIVPDEQDLLEEAMIEMADKKHMNLILTTGGIFLCLVYLGLFSYITYKAIKLHKHYPKYTMFYFVSLVPYLLYQFGEAFVPLFNVFGGGMMGFFLIAVVNMKYREVNETCDIKYLFVHNDNKEKENVA